MFTGGMPTPRRDTTEAPVVSDELVAPIGNGLELCYQTFGDPGAQPLLLVMGLGGPMTWWDSEFCEEDSLEGGSDFIPPTVANGKLYLATGANKVEVFGLIKPRECAPRALPDFLGPMLQ